MIDHGIAVQAHSVVFDVDPEVHERGPVACGRAESIGDIVRILTISDIFAALIEHRHYKPTMPRAEAYNVLCGMNGKLEKALVHSFKQVALTR